MAIEIETPALLLNRSRLERNAVRMLSRAEQLGLVLRPHVKTTKSAEIARIAHGGDIGPITVSTLREADYFLSHGFNDLTYAVCITPNKFAHASELVRQGARLQLLLADEAIARKLHDHAIKSGVQFDVLVEIDSGEHRTGFAPGDPRLVVTALFLNESTTLNFAGLLTHGGHAYSCTNVEGIVAVAEQERSALVAAKSLLSGEGIAVPVVSSGSTPTAVHGKDFSGIDELRPGVYLFGDLFQAQIGVCDIADIAVSVLASVIAHDRQRNRLVLDAGGLALSKDRSTQNSPIDFGYGLVVDVVGNRFDPDLIVCGVHQEHGEVASSAPLPFERLPVGSCVRVLPNHACMTAASYDRYHVIGGSQEITHQWSKVTGW